MTYAQLISKPNLTLAWRRLTTTREPRYKQYFRHLLEAYELSYVDNIKDLHRRLNNLEFRPTLPSRIYMPKASGLQRPITLLCIEDQIIYQAIANVFAAKVRDRRHRLVGNTIFSNWPTKEAKSIFFLQPWKFGYLQLRKVMKELYGKGYCWEVQLDLASFYETISHELIIKTIAPRQGNHKLISFIKQCMKTWSADTQANQHDQGIPQGPIASDFMAECILLPIDEEMHSKYTYLRYVDDIRILGNSEQSVRQAMVELDILCREKGLIPNTDKTSVICIRTEEQLLESIPPINLYNESNDDDKFKDKTIKLIHEAIRYNIDDIELVGKSKLRYVLFNTGQSDELLAVVTKLWLHHPEHMEAFVVFLNNYERVDDVVELCKQSISSPYDYVRGEAWKILARMCYKDEATLLLDDAIKASKQKDCCATRIGAYRFLLACEELGLGKYQKWILYEQSPIIQSIITPNLDLSTESGITIARQILQRTLIDPSLGLLTPLLLSRRSFPELGMSVNNIGPIINKVYTVAGIIPSTQIVPDDIIGRILSQRYKIPYWPSWRLLFGTEFQYAHSILSIAEPQYHFKSPWLDSQDSFNDALFRALNRLLVSKNAPGSIFTNPKSGIEDYGNLLYNGNFVKIYPQLAAQLQVVHARRCTLPSTHPYDKKTGKKNTPLNTYEQRQMVAHLRVAYNEIIQIASKLGL